MRQNLLLFLFFSNLFLSAQIEYNVSYQNFEEVEFKTCDIPFSKEYENNIHLTIHSIPMGFSKIKIPSMYVLCDVQLISKSNDNLDVSIEILETFNHPREIELLLENNLSYEINTDIELKSIIYIVEGVLEGFASTSFDLQYSYNYKEIVYSWIDNPNQFMNYEVILGFNEKSCCSNLGKISSHEKLIYMSHVDTEFFFTNNGRMHFKILMDDDSCHSFKIRTLNEVQPSSNWETICQNYNFMDYGNNNGSGYLFRNMNSAIFTLFHHQNTLI